MIVFYSDKFDDRHVYLAEEELLHCTKVLRKNIGDFITVLNGQGTIFSCQIASLSKNSLTATILQSETYAPRHPNFAISISPTKNIDRIEWFVEKATEIGITEIHLLMTKRTERTRVKMDRLEKIMISAMKQSKSLHLPKLHFIESWKDGLETLSKFEVKLIAHCEELTRPIQEELRDGLSTVVLIGPEGDFTPEEIQQALSVDFKPVSLGAARLRTETAGLYALTVMHQSSFFTK